MTFTRFRIDVPALQRGVRASIAALALATLSLWSAVAHGQANCPNPTQPDLDYNCPVGPVYTTPSFGNVPWLVTAEGTPGAAGGKAQCAGGRDLDIRMADQRRSRIRDP
jgi:hypothetical protein